MIHEPRGFGMYLSREGGLSSAMACCDRLGCAGANGSTILDCTGRCVRNELVIDVG